MCAYNHTAALCNYSFLVILGKICMFIQVSYLHVEEVYLDYPIRYDRCSITCRHTRGVSDHGQRSWFTTAWCNQLMCARALTQFPQFPPLSHCNFICGRSHYIDWVCVGSIAMAARSADTEMATRKTIVVLTRRHGTHAWCMGCKWFRCDNVCSLILLRCVTS